MSRIERVLLVNTNTLQAPYPAPPLGVCLAAASLEARCEVQVYDGAFDRGSRLAAVVAGLDPQVVGLGIRNVDDQLMEGGQGSFVQLIAELFVRPLRRAFDGPLILGGAGYSIFPRELLELLGADYGVVGPAEPTLAALLLALEQGRDPARIPGVMRRGQPASFPVAAAATGTDRVLDLPPSRIDLRLDYAPYRERGAYPIQTRRGCAFECIYCTYPRIEGRRYRLRPAGQVVREIEEVVARQGPVLFEFVDSVFNDPPGQAEAICREIIASGLKVRLRTMGINPRGVTGELLELMKEAGFAQMDCTPDSASPAVLLGQRKGLTLADLERAARLVKAHDMPTMWFFTFGGPGETEETFVESAAFIERSVSCLDMVHMTEGLRIYPGTGLHDLAQEQGLVRPDDPLLHPCFYVSPALGRERLLELTRALSRRLSNCVRACESKPGAAMLREARRRQEEQGLTEPMFRTLLRLRREGWTGAEQESAGQS